MNPYDSFEYLVLGLGLRQFYCILYVPDTHVNYLSYSDHYSC